MQSSAKKCWFLSLINIYHQKVACGNLGLILADVKLYFMSKLFQMWIKTKQKYLQNISGNNIQLCVRVEHFLTNCQHNAGKYFTTTDDKLIHIMYCT